MQKGIKQGGRRIWRILVGHPILTARQIMKEWNPNIKATVDTVRGVWQRLKDVSQKEKKKNSQQYRNRV